MADIPKNLGVGEGGGRLSKLEKLLNEVADDLARFNKDEVIPIVFESAQTGLTADATGVQFTSQPITITENMADLLKESYIETTFAATQTDAVIEIQLYDNTAGSVITSVSSDSATNEKSADGGELTVGNEIVVRAEVTTASATDGATFDLEKANIILGYGIESGDLKTVRSDA